MIRRSLEIETPKVFRPLLAPDLRYLGAHGGRGSGKSHFFAEKMIEDSLCEPGLLSVCIREVQKSLKDSAKRLLEGKLAKFGLGEADGFKVFREVIETPKDGTIIFQGMQDHTAESIKSLEGFKRSWVEEAQSLSARSLELLQPTIRAPGSQHWMSWNPRNKRDPVDKLLRGFSLPPRSAVVQVNWRDNPYFTAELEEERRTAFRDNPDRYDHIWEGAYAKVTEGAYFARQLSQARTEGRIGRVSADPLLPIRLVADIGGTSAKSDSFVFWAVQFVGREIRVLDHYEVVGQEIGEHLTWMRSRRYTPDRVQIILPHDGVKHDSVYRVTYESAFSDAGYDVTVIPNQGAGAATQRIEAARRVFPSIWFNESTTEDGIEALGAYHERRDEDRSIGLGPEHDWASHSADSFGLACVVYEQPSARKPPPIKLRAFGAV